MPFRTSPDKINKRKDYSQEDQLWKKYITKEDDGREQWYNKWGWIVDEIKQAQAERQILTDKSEFIAYIKQGIPKRDDNRSVLPVPSTTNHFYGWLATREDFRLDIYGPDVDRGLPLPERYKL